MFCFFFKGHLSFRTTTNTLKADTVSSSFSEAKLLFFSALLAYSQRNDHFCGCKGTHFLPFWQVLHISIWLKKHKSFP